MSTKYNRFARILLRCKETASEPGMDPVVVAVYKEGLETPATEYLSADDAVTKATTAHAKEGKEAHVALVELDAPYRVARAAVMTIRPENVKTLPDTIKSLSTDTDQLTAITSLLETINTYAGSPWADALLKGDFGVMATAAIKEMTEEIAANKALSKAKTERSAAYGPAHEKYIGFKRVVRNALGANSKQYKRIHMRASPGTRGKDDEGAAPDKGAAGADKASAPSVDVKAPTPVVDVKAPTPVVDVKVPTPAVDSKDALAGDTKACALSGDTTITAPLGSDVIGSLAEASAPAPESRTAP